MSTNNSLLIFRLRKHCEFAVEAVEQPEMMKVAFHFCCRGFMRRCRKLFSVSCAVFYNVMGAYDFLCYCLSKRKKYACFSVSHFFVRLFRNNRQSATPPKKKNTQSKTSKNESTSPLCACCNTIHSTAEEEEPQSSAIRTWRNRKKITRRNFYWPYIFVLWTKFALLFASPILSARSLN